MAGVAFEPVKIAGMELRNRFVRSATWDASADDTGAVTDTSLELYRGLSRGGIGLIVSGYAFISHLGRANPGQYGIHTDDMVPGLCRLAETVHRGGEKIAVQIVHAGINSRYLSRHGIESLAMSRLPDVKQHHREMTSEEIEGIIEDFARAAVRGREAGFDAVQLHGAHGYFLSQVLSPLYNRRTDRWGGSPENRRRFHVEVVRRMRRAVGDDFPLMIKLGVMDDVEGGLTLEDGIETARQMVAAGLNAVEISAGMMRGVMSHAAVDGPEDIPFRERTAAVKRAIDVPVIMVNGIRKLETAEDIITSGEADMVAMSRPFIREPDLIARWQRGETSPAKCISCGRCMPILWRGEPLQCGEERRLREEGVSAG